MKLSDFTEVSITKTTDYTLPAYSHSILNSIATCPTLGLVTYHANRVMSNPERAMALEAGGAAHECYAAARLWQVGRVQGLVEHMSYHGYRLFGDDRYESMCLAADEAGSDDRNAMLKFCLEAFYTSGFYDDPSDKRRTIVNIEEALIAYLDRFNFKRDVWVQDRDNPECLIGVELPIDITITFHGLVLPDGGDGIRAQIRFIGTADGVSTGRDDELELDENKTASRLGEAWAMSFQTSHQVTGYMLGLSVQYGLPVTKARVQGMCIPLPRSYDAGGLQDEVVRRSETQYQDFLQWILTQLDIVEQFGYNPLVAPKNTNACNKYFRPCSLIPLCSSDMESRQELFDMMVEREPSPSEKAMEDGT